MAVPRAATHHGGGFGLVKTQHTSAVPTLHRPRTDLEPTLHPTVRAHARDGILPTRPFTLAICSHVRRPNMRMQVDPRPERPGASMKSSVETTEEASSGGSSGNSISCDWDWDANNKDCKVLSLSFAAETSVLAAGCSDGVGKGSRKERE